MILACRTASGDAAAHGLTGRVNAPAAPGGGSVGRARRVLAWLERGVRAMGHVVADVCDAVRPPVATTTTTDVIGEPTPAADVRPRWGLMAVTTAIAGGLLAVRLSPATALYWYAFPLFGIGITYVVQFRAELTARWWSVLGASAVLSAYALAQDWAFSGHVLFDVLLLGHAAQSPARRTWVGVLLASLVHLLVLKFAFQRPMDAVGGVISVVVALAAASLAGPRRERRTAPAAAPASMVER
jgi:hypothetical protein